MHPEHGYEDYSADGGIVALDLLMGMAPSRRGAVGGALLLNFAPSMSLAQTEETASNHVAALGLLGPFVDAFPEPKWNLHLGGSIGFAALSMHPPGFSRYPVYGLGGAAWAGNQFWVGKEWSMGAALRVMQTFSGDEGGEFEFQTSSLATSLMFTATYH
jgi:hypothetical protein